MNPQQRGERLLAGAARRLLGDRRLLIATNRGPVTFSIGADGGLRQVHRCNVAPLKLGERGREFGLHVPPDLDVHLVMDNYAAHKTKLIRNWFPRRPRWHVHLARTSSSWLNQVERFFALLTDRQIRRRHPPERQGCNRRLH